MLILIDPSIAASLPRLMADDRFLECMDNLTIAHRKGTHIISGSARVIRTLVRAFDFDRVRSGVLRGIAAHCHEQASLIAQVTDYVIVLDHLGPSIQREHIAGRTVYSVSYLYFSKFSTALGSYIIAEDSTDVDIYTRSLEAYAHFKAADLRTLSQSVRGVFGGGSSTEDHFRERANEAPTLAIIDSDRQYPAGANGSTAVAVLRAARAVQGSTISKVEILDSHELENIIPPLLVRDCLNAEDPPEFVSRVEKVCSKLLNGTEAVRYIDLKNGIRRWDAFNRKPSEAAQYYLRQVQDNPIANACRDVSCTVRDLCICIHVEGIGGGILARVAARLSMLSPQKVAEYLFGSQSPTRDLWLAIAKRLFSWACAARPMRA